MTTELKTDAEFFTELFQSIAVDLGMIMDTEVSVGDPEVERVAERAVGEGSIHISFRFLVNHGGTDTHGSVLVPLADAVTLAGHLMMLGKDELAEARAKEELDRPIKEALLEVGNFVAGAIDAVIRTWYPNTATCRSVGCQGVRADVRPAFPYEEGEELVVARAETSVADFPAYSLIVQLPPPPAE